MRYYLFWYADLLSLTKELNELEERALMVKVVTVIKERGRHMSYGYEVLLQMEDNARVMMAHLFPSRKVMS